MTGLYTVLSLVLITVYILEYLWLLTIYETSGFAKDAYKLSIYVYDWSINIYGAEYSLYTDISMVADNL